MRLARPWVSSQSSSCGRQMSRLCRALSTSTSEFAALLTYVSDPCTPRCQLARGVASAHAGQRRLVLVWAGGAATVVRVSHPRGNSTRRWWYSPLIYVSLGHTRRHDRGPVLAEWANGTHPSPRNSGLQRIYTSEKFAILRFCMFTYQLDLASLAIWQYSLRTSCDYWTSAARCAKEQPHHGQDHGFPHPLQPAQWAAC